MLGKTRKIFDKCHITQANQSMHSLSKAFENCLTLIKIIPAIRLIPDRKFGFRIHHVTAEKNRRVFNSIQHALSTHNTDLQYSWV